MVTSSRRASPRKVGANQGQEGLYLTSHNMGAASSRSRRMVMAAYMCTAWCDGGQAMRGLSTQEMRPIAEMLHQYSNMVFGSQPRASLDCVCRGRARGLLGMEPCRKLRCLPKGGSLVGSGTIRHRALHRLGSPIRSFLLVPIACPSIAP